MTSIQPVHYHLHLEPDLKSFLFQGCVEIQFETSEPTSVIRLNALELAIWDCAVKQDDSWEPCYFSYQPKNETLVISLPEETVGPIQMRINYSGRINDKMAGFYRSAYQVEGQQRYIAISQFEESDARRAFPCMDHPLYKATYEIEMVVADDLKALSNESVSSETDLGDGRRLVCFARTPKMSTYLVFLGTGEFEILRDKKDRRVAGLGIPGSIPQLKLGVEFGRESLQYCEKYTGIAYPLSKLDLIAVPDFAFGAMENWGAVTFRENLLLYDSGRTSKAGMQRICEVIAHEIVHQWFGNLVSPSDWKYLWLNESFATYFGYGIVDHYYPDWGTWNQFLLGQTETALQRDALNETFPIEIPGGEHVIINTSTAPIIYSKGGSLLRQIEGYIGPENFRKGLQRYLKSHAYQCATSQDLWEAFTDEAGMPVTGMVRQWVEQSGFPLVTARREDRRLFLSQQRFTYLPNKSEAIWPIPVALDLYDVDGKSRREVVLLSDRESHFDFDYPFHGYKLNAGQTGFYRCQYPASDLKVLGQMVKEKTLPADDRWGLQNDAFGLVRCGKVDLDDYLGLLSFYQDEDAFLPLSSIDANLFGAYLIQSGETKERLSETGRLFASKNLQRIGYEPLPDESQTVAMLREQMLWHAAVYGDADIRQFSGSQFDRLMRGERLHPDLAKSSMQVGALVRAETALKWLCQKLETTDNEHTRLNILVALGCFDDPDLIFKAARYTLDKVPDRNRFIPIVAMSANPSAIMLIWKWYQDHLAELEDFHPLLYERVIAAIVPTGGMADPEAVRSFFETYQKKRPAVADAIKLSLERLEINLLMARSVLKPN
jgi:tricorn protease interacting factor F2/3